MRFESARKKVSKLIYQRFVSTEPPTDNNNMFTSDTASKKGLSVFQIIQLQKLANNNLNDNDKLRTNNILEPSNIHTHTRTQHNNNINHTNNNGVLSTNNSQPSVSQQSPTTQHTNNSSVISANNIHTELYKKESSILQMGTNNNSIGVYGAAV